jgi:hypothetical protein
MQFMRERVQQKISHLGYFVAFKCLLRPLLHCSIIIIPTRLPSVRELAIVCSSIFRTLSPSQSPYTTCPHVYKLWKQLAWEAAASVPTASADRQSSQLTTALTPPSPFTMVEPVYRRPLHGARRRMRRHRGPSRSIAQYSRLGFE